MSDRYFTFTDNRRQRLLSWRSMTSPLFCCVAQVRHRVEEIPAKGGRALRLNGSIPPLGGGIRARARTSFEELKDEHIHQRR